ncbi:MAG TPA: prepilin-type N-terminal cleavage/methylation domain-containing protein [Candidatus Acidoferrales bacterium]|nr:prepilin-type N-terminal cleavage/methylation domain-containing protein [Candidatus Acidoferrales bacterium]
MRLPKHFRHRLDRRRARRPRWLAAGFTLIEMMIVVTIMLILMSIAAGRYEQSIIRAREAALKQDLSVMRRGIDQYTIDKQQPPQSLDDLVTAGYLRGIPVDPITRRQDWRTEEDQVVLTPEQTQYGLTDVHSNSDQVSPFEKTAYSSW